MQSKPTTITVRGQRVSNRTTRRYSLIAVRPEAITIRPEDEAHRIFGRECGTYVAFAEVVKRSDSPTKLDRERMRGSRGIGVAMVIIDTETGEEI